jgi:AcrR family transcriptional regulator
MSQSSEDPEQRSVGRRERKKLATRDALRRAALDLVAERGLDHVTVEDISEAADVSERTFFNYFSSKEEAVAAPDPSRSERLRAALAERPSSEDPITALRAVMMSEIDEVIARRSEWLLRARVVADNPSLLPSYVARFSEAERAVAEAVAERLGVGVDAEIYPRLVAAAALSAWRAAVTRWNSCGGTESLEGLVAESFDLLANGLRLKATSS